MKTCSACHKNLPLSCFHKDKSSKDKHSYKCKPCALAHANQWYAAKKHEIDWLDRWGGYLKRYWPDKTREEAIQTYFDLLENQNNVCKICNKPETFKNYCSQRVRKLAVDHCHKTGKVRGLLCNKCNKAIGQFSDDINLLKSALNYLERQIHE